MAAMTDAFKLMADKHVGEKDDDAGVAFAKRVWVKEFFVRVLTN